jgi:hypothetical protein
MPVDHGAVRLGDDRSSEPKFPDRPDHTIDFVVVFAWISGVFDEPVGGHCSTFSAEFSIFCKVLVSSLARAHAHTRAQALADEKC